MPEDQQVGLDVDARFDQRPVSFSLAQLLAARPGQHPCSIVDAERVGVAAVLNQAVVHLLVTVEENRTVFIQLKIGSMNHAQPLKRELRGRIEFAAHEFGFRT